MSLQEREVKSDGSEDDEEEGILEPSRRGIVVEVEVMVGIFCK